MFVALCHLLAFAVSAVILPPDGAVLRGYASADEITVTTDSVATDLSWLATEGNDTQWQYFTSDSGTVVENRAWQWRRYRLAGGDTLLMQHVESSRERTDFTAAVPPGRVPVGTAPFTACGGFEQLTERDIRGNVSRWQAAGISQRLLYGDNGPYISFAGRVIAKITEAPGGGERRYDYAYSPLGFLTRADFSDSARPTADYSTAYEYDRQANLTKIVRHGTAFGALRGSSTLEITLEGNRVSHTKALSDLVHLESAPALSGVIVDPIAGGGFVSLADMRRYDADGNLTYDPDRGISHIAYNDAGRPQSVTFSSGDRIRYVYSAAGRKLAERQLSADGLSDRTRLWVGGYEITVDGNGGLSAVGDRRLLLPQGYVDIKAYVDLDGTPVYSLHLYVADVQGNVVGLYDCSARALEQFTDYYPYGSPHPDATGADRQRRKFGGKELLSELGLDEYDFDARRLLSAVSSFSQPDPLAGIYPWISPYAYCGGDPINNTDPTGMYTLHNIKEDTIDRIICIFPTSGLKDNTYIDKDLSFYIMNGFPVVEVDDFTDLVAALYNIEEVLTFDCIVFNSHGEEGSFSIGIDKITKNTDFSQLKDCLSGKNTFLYTCSTGKGNDGTELTGKMSKEMECNVISSTHPIKCSYDFSGGPGLWFSKDGYDVNFKLGTSDGQVSDIYNFRLSRDGSMTWNNNSPDYIDTFINYLIYLLSTVSTP